MHTHVRAHSHVYIHIHMNLTIILLVSTHQVYGNGILLFWVHLIDLLPIPRRKRLFWSGCLQGKCRISSAWCNKRNQILDIGKSNTWLLTNEFTIVRKEPVKRILWGCVSRTELQLFGRICVVGFQERTFWMR